LLFCPSPVGHPSFFLGIRRRRPLRLMATMMTTTPTAEAVD